MSDALFEMPSISRVRAGRPIADSYEEWIGDIRPRIEPWLLQAAAGGREFTIYQMATELDLKEPPDQAHHWGRLATLLQDEGLIAKKGWTTSTRPTSHVSGVRTWIALAPPELGAA